MGGIEHARAVEDVGAADESVDAGQVAQDPALWRRVRRREAIQIFRLSRRQLGLQVCPESELAEVLVGGNQQTVHLPVRRQRARNVERVTGREHDNAPAALRLDVRRQRLGSGNRMAG